MSKRHSNVTIVRPKFMNVSVSSEVYALILCEAKLNDSENFEQEFFLSAYLKLLKGVGLAQLLLHIDHPWLPAYIDIRLRWCCYCSSLW